MQISIPICLLVLGVFELVLKWIKKFKVSLHKNTHDCFTQWADLALILAGFPSHCVNVDFEESHDKQLP